VTVLLVGAGRMGLRHLRGLRAAGAGVAIVDPRAEARDEAGADAAFASLEDALDAGSYQAAVLAETAAGRLERFTALAQAGIGRVLVEKPVEQSRASVHALAQVASAHGVDARVNHFFRGLPLFARLREAGGPFQLSVTGGAYGLACNGIHWIDLALFLSGDGPAELLFGELDETPIASGRGPAFCDYGGRGVFALAGGSRLYLASSATSSAPMHAVLEQPTTETVLFPHDELAWISSRAPESTLPPYRYGADYARVEEPALAGDDLWRATERWARGESSQPPLSVSVRAHDLLFDLLEVDGGDVFPVT
jgi:predicted dehydrogenase